MRLRRMLVTCLVVSMAANVVARTSDTPPVYTADPAQPTCEARDQACRDWLRFREPLAGPYQGFAVAVHQDRATVIIAEPSAARGPFLALVDATFGDDVIQRSYKRWPTGLDGWLEDLVLDVKFRGDATARVVSGHDLAAWDAPAPIVDRMLFLYTALHATTDGFSLDNVNDFPGRSKTASVPEPAAPAADLFDWLTDASHNWTRADGAVQGSSFKTLQATRSPSVYVRSDGSLVALAIPAKSRLTDIAAPFRGFAVASDFLLGAYKLTNGTTFLIGRARQEPFTTLPPLRFETFASLVRHRTTELVQSYERQRIFAGRVRNGPFMDWDWAPILLSGQLDDSEFGTLLNQADQILKSWSQAGEVEYYAFNHPTPDAFPFDDKPATEYFGEKLGTTSLVFNWNTQALSTIFQVQSGELLSIDRHGALPILYIPSGNIVDLLGVEPTGALNDLRKEITERQTSSVKATSASAAATARKYFAELGDPILIRVGQNVLLYQISQAFLESVVVTPPGPVKAPRWEIVSRILRDQATKWLRSVASPGTTPGMSPNAEAALESVIRQSGLTIEQLAETIATPQVTSARLAAAVARYRRDMDHYNLGVFPQLRLAGDSYAAAFDAFCRAVQGTKKVSPRLFAVPDEGRTICEYAPTNASLGARELARLKALEARVDALDSEAAALESRVKHTGEEVVSLFEAYNKADGLAQTLAREASFTAQLDDVLTRVRNGVASEPTGSIRTPALVLSRNTSDEGAIGGHNIAFDPKRVRIQPSVPATPPIARGVAPGRTRRKPAALATAIRQAGAPPPQAAADALKVSRRGSLLTEMRASYNRPIDATTASQLARRAETCGCDALVFRTAEGEMFFVRTQPPPVQRRLVGTTAIAEALAGPPKATVVRFDGFAGAQGFVESVVQSTQLARNAGAETTPLARLAEYASSLFRRGDSPGDVALFSYTRRNGAVETLRVATADGAVGPILHATVPWRTATVSAGEVTVLGSGRRSTSALVRFAPGRGTATIEHVGVEVQVAADRAAVTPQRLQAIVSTALAKTPAAASAVAEGLLTLRRSIQTQMTPAEITFFIGGRGAPIRVSELMEAVPGIAGQ
jgi:hypothetical protein